MTIRQALKKARTRVRRGWAHGAGARARNGRVVPLDKHAACVCALGAIWLADWWNYSACKTALERCLPAGVSIVDFNDAPRRTKRQVIDLFDRAIASVRP